MYIVRSYSVINECSLCLCLQQEGTPLQLVMGLQVLYKALFPFGTCTVRVVLPRLVIAFHSRYCTSIFFEGRSGMVVIVVWLMTIYVVMVWAVRTVVM